MQPPEKRAREQIDAQLAACGWLVQDYKQLNLGAARGIAEAHGPAPGGIGAYPDVDQPDHVAPRQLCRPAKRETSEALPNIRTEVTERGGKVVPNGVAATRPDELSQTGPKVFSAADLLGHSAPRQHSRCTNARDGHRETRAVRWQRLDEDLVYDDRGPPNHDPPRQRFSPRKRERWFCLAKELDRSVVVKSQIRTVLSAFKDSLPELFPGRTLVPNTLMFAKDVLLETDR